MKNNITIEVTLSNSKISHLSYSDLEKVIDELTRIQKENLSLLYEVATLKSALMQQKAYAHLESKARSGVNKYFRAGGNR